MPDKYTQMYAYTYYLPISGARAIRAAKVDLLEYSRNVGREWRATHKGRRKSKIGAENPRVYVHKNMYRTSAVYILYYLRVHILRTNNLSVFYVLPKPRCIVVAR